MCVCVHTDQLLFGTGSGTSDASLSSKRTGDGGELSPERYSQPPLGGDRCASDAAVNVSVANMVIISIIALELSHLLSVIFVLIPSRR